MPRPTETVSLSISVIRTSSASRPRNTYPLRCRGTLGNPSRPAPIVCSFVLARNGGWRRRRWPPIRLDKGALRQGHLDSRCRNGTDARRRH
nr:hypothetical protein asmbl_7 [uncultured bacterium]